MTENRKYTPEEEEQFEQDEALAASENDEWQGPYAEQVNNMTHEYEERINGVMEGEEPPAPALPEDEWMADTSGASDVDFDSAADEMPESANGEVEPRPGIYDRIPSDGFKPPR